MTLWLDVDDLFYFAERSARPTGIQRLTGEVYIALAERDPERVRFVVHNERPGLFKVVAQDFVKELLRYYDPITHYFLFEAGGEGHEIPHATPDTTRRLM